MNYLEFSGNVDDHVANFADSDWLSVHHEAAEVSRREFVESLGLDGSSKVLDVACGVGGWARTFAAVHDRITCIAFDPIHTSVMRASREDASQRNYYVVADATHLPFREEAFDVVFVANSVHYPSVHDSLIALYKLLKRQGRLIVRNFDEGQTLVYPCSPRLHSKVLWAAAKAVTEDPDAPVNPYAGRELKAILSSKLSADVRFSVSPTKLEFPFTPSQRNYIIGNIRWLGSVGRKYLSHDEYAEWSSLADQPERFLDNAASYYIVFEFCAEVMRDA